MLYDLNFLNKGAEFPPRDEIRRLDAYRVNAMLLDDEAWSVLPEYKHRVMYLLSNFSLAGNNEVYLFNANYWADLVNKTQELTYGDPPEFKTPNEEQLNKILDATELIEKAKEGCSDFVALGDWVTKIVENENGETFINVDPATWFPVVSRENVKEIKLHVLAWIEQISEKNYELHVQVHEKGRYANRAFAISAYNPASYYVVESTRQKIQCPTYTIGAELAQSKTGFPLGEFNTGLSDFAIITSANNAGTRRICGVSDFDNVTDAIMEYNVRMTLKNVVLDKHSAPKLCGPPLVGDSNAGNYLEVESGQTTPSYLVWDASMQAVENTINGLKDDVSNLSGMGSLLNSKTFGESQGYDALMIKLAPALMRSAGKKVILEKHLKKLLSALSGKYGKEISPQDITVMWHDGIPTTESVRADIATKHLATGWSKKRVLMQDYGFDEETAEAIIEESRLETPAMPSFGIDEGGGFGDEGGEPSE